MNGKIDAAQAFFGMIGCDGAARLFDIEAAVGTGPLMGTQLRTRMPRGSSSGHGTNTAAMSKRTSFSGFAPPPGSSNNATSVSAVFAATEHLHSDQHHAPYQRKEVGHGHGHGHPSSSDEDEEDEDGSGFRHQPRDFEFVLHDDAEDFGAALRRQRRMERDQQKNKRSSSAAAAATATAATAREGMLGSASRVSTRPTTSMGRASMSSSTSRTSRTSRAVTTTSTGRSLSSRSTFTRNDSRAASKAKPGTTAAAAAAAAKSTAGHFSFVTATSSSSTHGNTIKSRSNSNNNNNNNNGHHHMLRHLNHEDTASIPLFELAALTPKEKQVNLRKLRTFLQLNGEFPSRYRPLIWRFLLRLPENTEAFSDLVNRGIHPAFEDLHDQYPIQAPKIFDRLQSVCSQLAHWAPILADVSCRLSLCLTVWLTDCYLLY